MKTRLRVLRAEMEWSTGKYDPSLPLAFKIARAFGKNVEEVFLYPEEQDGVSPLQV